MAYFDNVNKSTVEAYTSALPPVVSLSAASSVGAGTVLDGLVVRTVSVLSVTTSAGVSAGAVQLEGSLDGINWYDLGSAVSITTASTTTNVSVSNTYARYVRAAITTAITGGTVTASIGVA